MLALTSQAAAEPPGEPVPFASLPGFAGDDLEAAFRTFLKSCQAHGTKPLRAATPSPPGLAAACNAADLRHRRRGLSPVRAFFAQHFEARRVAGDAFFTGYYEPAVDGSLQRSEAFATPLYPPPVGFTPMPDRAAIETGALGRSVRPLVYVGSPVEAFFIQVQGSARIRLPDGALRRLVFAGRNGYPYTSIGKLLVQRLGIPPSQMGMSELKAWIRANGQGEGDAGTKLMRENRSYIFFRFDESLAANAGPIGGEGISLTPGRSLAVDKSIWPYGLPFYLDTVLPDARPFRRLMVAQDTGSAILGPARADIFFGTGREAADQAGAIRQSGTLYVLWPVAPAGKARPTPR